MYDSHELLKAITVVLCVGAVITAIFQRLRQPVVLGYLLSGLIVGPYVPVPLVADRAIIQILSELGVILLMFALGLEFSLRKLRRVGPRAGVTALVQSGLMFGLGFALAGAFDWTTRERVFAGAIIAISSTTIIAKAFDEQQITGTLREFVVGILIVEDLIAILLMAILTAFSTGRGVSAETLAESSGGLLAFLVGLMVIGMLVVPRAIRAVSSLGRAELTLIASMAICFGIALLAQEFGYSVALGAFIAGSLIAESGEAKAIEKLILPVRDLFAAIFFVSVGMLFDPGIVVRYGQEVALFTVLVIVGKFVFVVLGASLTGVSIHSSVRAGMSLAQIGEFSFIIAELGNVLGATRGFLYSIAVAVSVVTAFTTPWMIRVSEPAAALIERRMPKRWRSTLSLYALWLGQLRNRGPDETPRSRLQKWARLLAIDVLCLLVILVGAALGKDRLCTLANEHLGLSQEGCVTAVVTCAVLFSLPFLVGIVRIAGRVGAKLADAWSLARSATIETPSGRALTIALQLAVVLLACAPLLALLLLFIPPGYALGIGASSLALIGVRYWRRAPDPHQRVQAGAEMVADVLSKQSGASKPS